MSDALAHLRAFRATFNDGDQVDEESGLTAADLDEAIKALQFPRIPVYDINDKEMMKRLVEQHGAKQYPADE